MSTRVTRRHGSRARGSLATALVATVLASGAANGTAAAVEAPPVVPGTRPVMIVSNNWDGTADLVDPRTYEVLDRLNVIPDIEERMAEIRTNPVRLAYFLAIRQFIGEGNDQYVDDAFSSHDGRTVFVSRPSLADVVAIDLASGDVVWRFPMEGQRSDHMGISPDGTRLVVSDSTANKAHVLDTRTGEKVDEFASGDSPHENTFSRDGSRLFHASIGLVYTPLDRPALDTTKGERYLQVVDTSDYSFERDDLTDNLERREGAEEGQPYPDSSAVRPMAVPPDEESLFFQLSFFHGYVQYDLATNTIVDVVNLPNLVPDVPREQYLLDSAHHGLAINPEGTKLCVAGTMSDYGAIVPVDSPEDHVLVQPIVKPYWSTNGFDGRTCWLSASGADEVVVVDYATGSEVTRIPVGDHPQRMRLGIVQSSLLEAEPPAAPSGSPTPGTSTGGTSSPGTSGQPAPVAQPASGRSLAATGAAVAAPAAGLALLAAAAVVRRRASRPSD